MRELTADSDTVLMSAVSDGNTAALKVLYERHSPWIGSDCCAGATTPRSPSRRTADSRGGWPYA